MRWAAVCAARCVGVEQGPRQTRSEDQRTLSGGTKRRATARPVVRVVGAPGGGAGGRAVRGGVEFRGRVSVGPGTSQRRARVRWRHRPRLRALRRRARKEQLGNAILPNNVTAVTQGPLSQISPTRPQAAIPTKSVLAGLQFAVDPGAPRSLDREWNKGSEGTGPNGI